MQGSGDTRWEDPRWRLDNLYRITDAEGRRVPFRMNAAQAELFDERHTLNVVLKARQLGFTTLIQLLMLDACLFTPDVRAGTIAHTLGAAEAIFRDKVKFPLENLDPAIRRANPAVADSARTLRFANNSMLRVDTSLRSGTYQYLHVSEFGRIAARTPDKAREIRTGALNAVRTGQTVFIESTAEGREGDFFEICEQARNLARQGRRPSDLDFKYFFFPWWQDPGYRIDPDGVVVGAEDAAYFEGLEAEHGIVLDAEQRAWYARKRSIQRDDMPKEYPATPEEAFRAAVEGAYYARELARARTEGRISAVPCDPGLPVNTFWDLGVDDETAIWFHQQAGLEHRFIDYHAESGEGLAHYARVLRERDYFYGEHYLPHDVEVRSLSTGRSRLDTLKGLGVTPVRVVPRTESVGDGIEAVRSVLSACRFDEVRCGRGLKALEGYRKAWDERRGTFRDRPLHDWSSHGADAFRCFAEGYRPGRGGALGPPARRRSGRAAPPEQWQAIMMKSPYDGPEDYM